MADSKVNASVKIFEKWRRRSVADEIIVCWICNRDLVGPRTLPCLHSFCEECILVLLKTYERRGKLERTFRCPQCKTLVPNYIPEKVSRKSKGNCLTQLTGSTQQICRRIQINRSPGDYLMITYRIIFLFHSETIML